MRRDKAWIEVDGQPMVARALATVRKLGVREVFVSGRAQGDYSKLECPVLLDREPGFGPLAGIERALEACSSPLLLVLAVDLPRMTAEFLGRLVEACEPARGIVPRLDGQLEPLAAIYPKRSHAVILDLIRESRHAACEFAEICLQRELTRIHPVEPKDAGCFVNWNNPSDIS